jgi:kinetochore protein NNF1
LELTFGCKIRPHTLNAKELYQAHLTPHLEKAQQTLDSKLEKTHAENAELAEKIQLQRQEIESLLASLEGVVGDLEGAVAATAEFNTEGNLRQEVMQMDEAVKASPQP